MDKSLKALRRTSGDRSPERLDENKLAPNKYILKDVSVTSCMLKLPFFFSHLLFTIIRPSSQPTFYHLHLFVFGYIRADLAHDFIRIMWTPTSHDS